MNPVSIQSGRSTAEVELSMSTIRSIDSSPENTEKSRVTELWYKLQPKLPEGMMIFQNKYFDACNKIYHEHYQKETSGLLEVFKTWLEQKKNPEKIIIVPNCLSLYFDSLKKIIETFLLDFCLGFSDKTLSEVSLNCAMTFLGLIGGLEYCFSHRSFLEQAVFSFPTTPANLEKWFEYDSEIESMRAVQNEIFDDKDKPIFESESDEIYVRGIYMKLANFINDDAILARLLTLLIFFSPFSRAGPTEKAEIKKYQKVLTIHIYSHLMEGSISDNATVTKKLADMTGLIPELHKCGKSFVEKMIQTDVEDFVENIDNILVSPINK